MPVIGSSGIISALLSAGMWGGGDFSGGYASRKSHPFQILVIAAFAGVVLLGVCALWQHETFPPLRGIIFSLLAGILGSIGIACLYSALSMGHTAIAASLAAVVGASLPALFTILVIGLPGRPQLLGFALALAGIWLVTQPAKGGTKVSRQVIFLAILAGVGFAGFFILIAQVEPGWVFTPLIIARSMALITGLVMLFVRRLPLPSVVNNPVAVLAGVLDAGGNIFFVLAKELARLDIVVMLASLYPVVTVLLAVVILKEHVSRVQWIGAGLCVLAIALISI